MLYYWFWRFLKSLCSFLFGCRSFVVKCSKIVKVIVLNVRRKRAPRQTIAHIAAFLIKLKVCLRSLYFESLPCYYHFEEMRLRLWQVKWRAISSFRLIVFFPNDRVHLRTLLFIRAIGLIINSGAGKLLLPGFNCMYAYLIFNCSCSGLIQLWSFLS